MEYEKVKGGIVNVEKDKPSKNLLKAHSLLICLLAAFLLGEILFWVFTLSNIWKFVIFQFLLWSFVYVDFKGKGFFKKKESL